MLERVVGARLEEPLPDLWLLVPADRVIFSRNERYVYRFRMVIGTRRGGRDEGRVRARGVREGRIVVVAPNR